MYNHLRATLAAAAAVLTLAATGCTSNTTSATGDVIKVTSTDDKCTLTAAAAPSGNLVF